MGRASYSCARADDPGRACNWPASDGGSLPTGRNTSMTELLRSDPVVHVRFEGRSRDVPLADLDLGPRPAEAEIKQVLARYLEVPAEELRDYVVDRHETGNLTVRPEAVFG